MFIDKACIQKDIPIGKLKREWITDAGRKGVQKESDFVKNDGDLEGTKRRMSKRKDHC